MQSTGKRKRWFGLQGALILLIVTAGCLVLSVALAATLQAGGNGSSGAVQAVPADQADAALATLTDEQVRSMLLARLQEEARAQTTEKTGVSGPVGLLARWLHLMDSDGSGEDMGRMLERLWRHAGALPDDLSWMVRRFADDASPGTAWRNIGIIGLLFLAAVLAELLAATLMARITRRLGRAPVPELQGRVRFWAAVLAAVPALVRVTVFASVAVFTFLWLDINRLESVRLLFMALLIIIVGVRLAGIVSGLFFSPRNPRLRLLPVADATAGTVHRAVVFLTAYILAGLAFLALMQVLQVQEESVVLVGLFLGTLLLLLLAAMVLALRRRVAEAIRGRSRAGEDNPWLREEMAALWHIPALLYLFMVWGMLVFRFVSGGEEDGAFLLSLLIVPVFFILDALAGWVVRVTIATLRIYPLPQQADDGTAEEEVREMERREQRLVARVRRMVRVVIILALGLWVLSAWGYSIPYSLQITRAVFNILVTLALALVFWRVVSSYIEQKIIEATPEEEENEEQDDEWGAAATRGRSYTLLPMVRKFIGTVLVVMVTLIVLSSIGVDIGPLLAGAGVVGLAIGFGAQKLVSDVFSGFFYLLDDAFRVGEYLQAGSVSGSVEAITLRNVMLRHHRGMLQIVPYSELGSITNFMRGGIVVKFNLEFPYDTDIDKVRKIIKKVGRAMLEDPEFGGDFIRPVKSQGVREITNSVMVIRVKFTAKPGTHFVIRREAYRRITEALAAQGIHYAHRKVIVELPQDENGSRPESAGEEQQKKIAELGAAAGLAAMAEEEAKKTADGGGGSGPAMPGM